MDINRSQIIDNLNNQGYYPAQLIQNKGENTLFIAKKSNRLLDFFNFKLLKNNPEEWSNRLYTGRKIKRFKGSDQDLAFIRSKLVSNNQAEIDRLKKVGKGDYV